MLIRFLLLAVVLTGGVTAEAQSPRQIPLGVPVSGSHSEMRLVPSVTSNVAVQTAKPGKPAMPIASEVADVAVSNEGTIWIAGTDGSVRFSKDGGGTWTQTNGSAARSRFDVSRLERMTSFVRVSARTDTTVFAVRADGTLWKYDGRNWTKTTASGMGDVAISQTGTVWAAGKNGTIWFSHDQGRNWTQVEASGFSSIGTNWAQVKASGFSSIAAGNDTQVWAVAGNGTLWTYDGQGWKEISSIRTFEVTAFLKDVAVGVNERVWVTDKNGGLFSLDNKGVLSLPAYNTGSERVAVATDPTVWYVKNDGTLWKLKIPVRSSPVTQRPSDGLNSTRTEICEQKILAFGIIRHRAGDYTFRFGTACPTIATIEFSDAPPVSVNPPRFKKKEYRPGELLVPTLSTGLKEQTAHSVDADLSQYRNLDYYILTIWDVSGTPTYKTGSMSRESVPDVRIKATDIRKVISP